MSRSTVGDLFAVLFDPKVPITFIIGSIILSVLGNAAYDLLLKATGEEPQTLAAIVVGSLLIFVFLTVMSVLWIRRQRGKLVVSIPENRLASRRQGLALFVSEGQQEAARAAIQFHAEERTLKACWLMLTPEARQRAAELISEAGKLGIHVTQVPLEDAFDAREAYACVQQTIGLARGMVGADQLIVDVTGGTKPMTAGAVLACVDEGIAMQYMRIYFQDGRPVAESEPKAMIVAAPERVP